MHAILKSKHQSFCDWLYDIKKKHGETDPVMDGLEAELQRLYELYQEKRDELKGIANLYEARQKTIRNRIKTYRRPAKTAITVSETISGDANVQDNLF